MTTRIDFYFDYISPYAYLGWHDVRRAARDRGWELCPKPVLFAAILAHWGQLGPAEIPPKRLFTFKDVLRRAADAGAPIAAPASHPFNPLTALRVSLPRVAGDRQRDVIDACYRATWVDAVDVSSPPALAAALDGADLDGARLVARASEPAVKEALATSTSDAIACGVFGVPTYVVDGELFFGHDRLGDVVRFVAGGDPVTAEHAEAMMAVRPSARRKR